MIVTLTWAELQQAAFVGCYRRVVALARGRRSSSGAGTPPYDLWGNDVIAAAAEMAVAKALDRFWAATNEPDYDGDVGEVHVRSTTRVDGRLILHPTDPDGGRFVLACGEPPTYRLVGWLQASAGKLPAFWRGELARPCFMVPQSVLEPMETLYRTREGERG